MTKQSSTVFARKLPDAHQTVTKQSSTIFARKLPDAHQAVTKQSPLSTAYGLAEPVEAKRGFDRLNHQDMLNHQKKERHFHVALFYRRIMQGLFPVKFTFYVAKKVLSLSKLIAVICFFISANTVCKILHYLLWIGLMKINIFDCLSRTMGSRIRLKYCNRP